ncbi:MAG: transposase [Cytophagaceae bacterium]|nr:transposase [Cytophagaceae bacterium]
MNLQEVYFWTNTIKDWKNLLKKDYYKQIIIEQLQWLKERNKISIYGFVIMPNHLHFLWEMKEMNGKEMPHASFNKWTSSNFLKELRANHQNLLPFFEEKTTERNHRFWQRDPLAVLMDSRDKIEQKLDYIHLNPLQEKWNLTHSPEEYYWSSAKFYLTGEDEFNILTHYMDRF